METTYKITYNAAEKVYYFTRENGSFIFWNVDRKIVFAYAAGYRAGKGTNSNLVVEF